MKLLPSLFFVVLCVEATNAATWSPYAANRASANATALLVDAQKIMGAAVNAILATHAYDGTSSSSAGGPRDINTRVVTPKPLPAVTNASGLNRVYIDTNLLSRKHADRAASWVKSRV